MKASYRWLVELSGIDAGPSEMAERLTRAGLEVEDVTRHGVGLDHVVVAEVRAVERVPEKDKLQLVTVFDGQGERSVICGAPNVPSPGGRVVLAKPGAVLPGGFEIRERKVGGVTSAGMLCSERELGIGASEGGILVLGGGEPGRPGQPLVDALGLDDSVLEIGLTPNRPDCLGHVGLAREVALAFGESFRVPSPGAPVRVLDGSVDDESIGFPLVEDVARIDTLTLVDASPSFPTLVPIRIDAPDRCPRYAGGVLHGVRVGPSPFWMRYRLHVLGLRSISNVVDITNWVLFELGHPIHAFDLARLNGPEIVVRLASDGERMRTIDGEERSFTRDDLLICDGAGPVAVAGVMGGAESEIRGDTKAVLVEVAYFDPRSVRRTSRRLGLHTDSSHRFERGVDPGGVAWAMRRAVGLISTLANGAAAPFARDVRATAIAERRIDFAPSHVERLLGMPVSEPDVRSALEGLGCSISPGETTGWRVSAPTWRPDLTRPEDLVEEVARVRGYDSIPTALPRVLPSGRGVAPRPRAARRLREAAADLGLLEAVDFAFVSRSDLERARVSTDALVLANPLSEERTVMRTSLLPGLLTAVARTRRHQGRSVALFELARTYHPRAGEALPEERLELAIVLAGPRVDHVGEASEYDFYDGKGVLESILQAAFGVALTLDADVDHPSLHPRRRARVRVAGEDVGLIGEIHPDVAEAFELGTRAIHAAVDVDRLLRAVASVGLPRARALPRFPAVARDLAVVLEEAVPAGRVADVLREAGGELVEAVELFDVYRGKGIPDGSKSLAYRVVYRDPEATLTDKRVEQAHRAAVRAVTERLGASVRE
jgi:phenylalanyl-tRNA synthetase beta chain